MDRVANKPLMPTRNMVFLLLRINNSINNENFDDIVYGDEEKCDLLNKYFSLIQSSSSEKQAIGPGL